LAEHICPVWAGYFLANRLRKLLQDPYKILKPYVTDGMAVLDVGCAMGFFSLPMAEMVGPEGKVVCVDMQPGMLTALRNRATRAGLADRIETHLSMPKAIGLQDADNQFDFALAFAVLLEISSQVPFLGEIHRLLKPGATFLVTEPVKHVSPEVFDRTISEAESQGFVVVDHALIRSSRAVALKKPEARQS